MRRWLCWTAGVALLASALAFTLSWAKDYRQLRERRQMLSGLELTCKLYASDHGGARPPDLRALFPTYVNNPQYLAYATNEVEYFPGATDESNPATVLMRERRSDRRGRQWVGHVDCDVEIGQAHSTSSPQP
jgi:type II secretory pathway pseudopilin PulG